VRRIRTHHHRLSASRGTDDAALFCNEEIRAFTTWNLVSLCRSNLLRFRCWSFVGPETKNPSGASAREGFGKPNWNGLRPFRLREKARTFPRPGRLARTR
jgi:hypothetical protein